MSILDSFCCINDLQPVLLHTVTICCGERLYTIYLTFTMQMLNEGVGRALVGRYYLVYSHQGLLRCVIICVAVSYILR